MRLVLMRFFGSGYTKEAKPLVGKVAIVKGAGLRIGRSIAERAKTVVTSLIKEPLDETITLIRNKRGIAFAFSADVTHQILWIGPVWETNVET